MNKEDENYLMLLVLTLLMIILIEMYFAGENGVGSLLKVIFKWWKIT
jgi:hypothetical protein